jgi:hypothetical protein
MHFIKFSEVLHRVRAISKSLFYLTVFTFPFHFVYSQTLNIENDKFWETKNGTPIYSQGGGIFTFLDPEKNVEKFYWYGVHYKEADLYKNNPSITQTSSSFVEVTCYSSVDLVNWESEDAVLNLDEINKNYPAKTNWMGRLGVAYVKGLNKYAMFIQHNNRVLITVSDTPTGPFKWHQRIDMTGMIGTSNTGDQTVFTDYDTGISYLVYSYGNGRNKVYISEIGVKDGKVNLLDCTQVFTGAGREGNCMFKHNGKYYLFASNLYGWDSSYAYYLVSNTIKGPYKPTNDMLIMPGTMDDYAHVTQTGFFVKLKRTNQELIIYCGDRWSNFAGNGLGYNQWCPLSFKNDVPYFNSLNSWNFDIKTGNWSVSENNNYVKNGSFEADRRHIPSPVKPIQEQLKGWYTEVFQGNVIVVGAKESPILNYFNTEEDRKYVIGEKSLNITDYIDFKRRVSQKIESTPFVKLENGFYRMSAKIKNSDGFKKLNMYAESAGNKMTYNILEKNEFWTEVEIDQIKVSNGRIEIGFEIDGNANATCLVDDITLTKSTK